MAWRPVLASHCRCRDLSLGLCLLHACMGLIAPRHPLHPLRCMMRSESSCSDELAQSSLTSTLA